jgi:phosphoglycerol transferase MdoB-like AlkP superfamily enzyme
MYKSFRLLFLQSLSFFTLIFLGKITFVLYHFNRFSELNLTDKIGIFTKGIRLDLSIVAYLAIIPFLFHILYHFFQQNKNYLSLFNRVYHLILCFIISCLIVTDLELYRTWGFRIDSTPLKYLSTPNEMMASVGASPFYILIPILIFLWVVSLAFNIKTFGNNYNFKPKNVIISLFVHFFLLASLIIPIRGGFQLAPINQSSAYFSKNAFANHSAINPIYNFFYSITKRQASTNPFKYLPDSEAKKEIDIILNDIENTDYQLNTTKPNLLLITWESLTSKVLNQKEVEVLPNFKKLINEGIFFDSCYASGDRSEKGLIALLSGYPAQPTTSIMTLPEKTEKLPVLSIDLKKNGYHTAWYYGGEPEFANIKSYISHGEFDEIITKDDFPKNVTENTKWGANDKAVFERLLGDLNKKTEPFFVNYFTLSSHEPYEIGDYQTIKGTDETHKFMNAHHYTDEQLGEFIENAKKQAWYKNTLIIIVADHGHRLPESNIKSEEFHIPLLILGGALNTQARIEHNICSQNDIVKTILNQLKLDSKQYIWSKDLFSKSYKPSAYFAFNNGFGFVQHSNWFVFDNDTKQIIQKKGNITPKDINKGKAYVQLTFADFLSK